MLQRLIASRSRPTLFLLLAKREYVSSRLKLCCSKLNHQNQEFTKICLGITTVTRFFHQQDTTTGPVSEVAYEQACEDTLESLCEYFEELVEQTSHLADTDVTLGDGVLTIQFGAPYGTYVINRQRPNLQIWLSSPTSGPKRYDFINGQWIYKHDGISLHQLLEEETSKIVKKSIDLSQCAYAKQIK